MSGPRRPSRHRSRDSERAGGTLAARCGGLRARTRRTSAMAGDELLLRMNRAGNAMRIGTSCTCLQSPADHHGSTTLRTAAQRRAWQGVYSASLRIPRSVRLLQSGCRDVMNAGLTLASPECLQRTGEKQRRCGLSNAVTTLFARMMAHACAGIRSFAAGHGTRWQYTPNASLPYHQDPKVHTQTLQDNVSDRSDTCTGHRLSEPRSVWGRCCRNGTCTADTAVRASNVTAWA